MAVFRKGTWQVRLATGATSSFTFDTGGVAAAVPVVGDWDGDGKDGIGTYTRASGTWSLRQTASAGMPDVGLVFPPSPMPTPSPETGTPGTGTVGVKGGTTWYLRNSNTAGPAHQNFDYGLPNDLPMTYRDGMVPPPT